MCDHKHYFTVNYNLFPLYNKSPLHFTTRFYVRRQFIANPGTEAGGDMSLHSLSYTSSLGTKTGDRANPGTEAGGDSLYADPTQRN